MRLLTKPVKIWLKEYWGWPFAALLLPLIVFSARWLYAIYEPFLTIPAQHTPDGKPASFLAGMAVCVTWVTAAGTVGSVLYKFFENLSVEEPQEKTPEMTDWR